MPTKWWPLIEATMSTSRFKKLLLDKYWLACDWEGGNMYDSCAVGDIEINDTSAFNENFRRQKFSDLPWNREIRESFHDGKIPAIGYWSNARALWQYFRANNLDTCLDRSILPPFLFLLHLLQEPRLIFDF